MGLDKDVALITDGRFSGATRGLPSAMCPRGGPGGPIGLVEEGDLIAIDIPAHSITLKVSDEELEARRAKWVCPEPKIKTGYLARYAKMVSSADRGAILSKQRDTNSRTRPPPCPGYLCLCPFDIQKRPAVMRPPSAPAREAASRWNMVQTRSCKNMLCGEGPIQGRPQQAGGHITAGPHGRISVFSVSSPRAAVWG